MASITPNQIDKLRQDSLEKLFSKAPAGARELYEAAKKNGEKRIQVQKLREQHEGRK